MRIKLDIPLRLSEIVKAVSGNIEASFFDVDINFITTDSRKVCNGDLFIAFNGRHFNGNEFVFEAVRYGAIALSTVQIEHGVTVNDTEEAFLNIAKLYKSKLSKLKCTVAITGSVGKSTTKDFLKLIAAKNFNVCATIENYNNSLGACISVLSSRSDTEILILEMGMNHSGEISKLSKAFNPDLAIITNIGTSHIGHLGSREAIASAKLEILDGMTNCELIVPYGEPLLSSIGKYSFSVKDRRSDFYLSENYGSISFYNGDRWILDSSFSLKEKHLLNCLAAAVTAALLIGVPVGLISKAVTEIGRDSVRQCFRKIGSFTLYEDLYNASLESISAALEYLHDALGYGKRSAFIGSVLELGERAESIHREIGKRASEYSLKMLYFFGDYAEEMKIGACLGGFSEDKIITFPDRSSHAAAAEQIIKHTETNELILIKGSRAMELEKIRIELLKRNHHA